MPSVLLWNVAGKAGLVTFNDVHLVLGKIRGDGGKCDTIKTMMAW